jgi:acyl-CoA hydrolase/RimJ/RimL family protein N-acetyltransferase
MAAPEWTEDWASKVTTAEGAVRHIKSGDHVFVGSGASTPQLLVQAMCSPSLDVADVEVTSIMTSGPAPYCEPAASGRFRHNAMFIGANARGAVREGLADYTPIHLSDVPRLFRSRQKPIDVALIVVSEPRYGTTTLGASVDVVRAAVDVAGTVIAEVNPRMPRTSGDAVLKLEEIDWLIPHAFELPEYAPAVSHGAAERIGGHIARLVEDGSTIQAGIGSIPDAALAALKGKRDLGVHTEMLSDGMVDLMEHGVVTNRLKALDPGRTVTSFVLGTRRAYDFVNDNADVLFRSTEYTNDPSIIARQPRMVAINGAIEVDLTGQVCADSVGSRFYSGFGGQVDFMRGASRSPGGKPIIALPSTVQDEQISRIVPRLAPGAGVVTNRADVHFVITEYGVADLHGKSARERALALVQIAHPRFRQWLMREAKALCLVYADQLEPTAEGPFYPEQWEGWFAARDGTRVFLRPVRPTDEDLLKDYFYGLSPETIYMRYAGVRKSLPHADRLRIANVDYESEMTIVAVAIDEDGHERVVGLGTYVVDRQRNEAETAFMVGDEYQGRGIGAALFRRLADVARTKGIRALVADVLPQNAAMFRVLTKSGLAVQIDERTGRVVVSLR